jgi:hypothetical protein
MYTRIPSLYPVIVRFFFDRLITLHYFKWFRSPNLRTTLNIPSIFNIEEKNRRATVHGYQGTLIVSCYRAIFFRTFECNRLVQSWHDFQSAEHKVSGLPKKIQNSRTPRRRNTNKQRGGEMLWTDNIVAYTCNIFFVCFQRRARSIYKRPFCCAFVFFVFVSLFCFDHSLYMYSSYSSYRSEPEFSLLFLLIKIKLLDIAASIV